MADPTIGISIAKNHLSTVKMMYEIEQEALAQKVSKELAESEFPNKIEEAGKKTKMIGMIPCKVANLKIVSTEDLNYDDQCTFNYLKESLTKNLAKERQDEMKEEAQKLKDIDEDKNNG